VNKGFSKAPIFFVCEIPDTISLLAMLKEDIALKIKNALENV